MFLIINLLSYFLISFNYTSSLKKRILATVLIYCILFCVEILTLIILDGITSIPLFKTNVTLSTFTIINVKIFSFIIVLLLKNFISLQKGENIAIGYWVSILIIPLGSLFTMLIVLGIKGVRYEYMILIVAVLLFMNFTTFYLYNAIIKSSEEKLKNALLEENNRYYEAQLSLIKSALKTLKIFKHDINNHLTVLAATLEKNSITEAREYINSLKNSCSIEKEFVHTGNSVVDSIINFKLNNVQSLEIKLNISIPEILKIDAYDMVCILGNLLDNGLKAACESKEKFISIDLKYEKQQLILKIENTHAGEVIEKKGKFITTKTNKKNHGTGLESVRIAVKKYNGILDIRYNENLFTIFLILYSE